MNIKSFRTERKLARALRPGMEWRALPAAFLATLMALPVNAAVTIPSDPLASGVRVAPNILFILDDSGSMAWENINNGDISAVTGVGSFSDGPDNNGVTAGNTGDYTDATGNNRMYDQNFVTNTLYYNPSVEYEPWFDATGNRLTGGTQYTAAYSSTNYVTYTGVASSTSGGTEVLTTDTRTFYAPKLDTNDTTAYLSNIENYYRFQILMGGARIMRGEYGRPAVTNNNPNISPSSGSLTSNAPVDSTTVPATGNSLEITIRNTSSGTRNLNYWVYAPSGATACSGTITAGGSSTCTTFPAEAGGYTIRAQRATSSTTTYTLSSRTSTSCDASFNTTSYRWANCTEDTPVVPDSITGGKKQRALDDEKINFATWYSYYRTRIKTAKGGAAEAFNSQGNKVRVGYRSLHQNGSNNFNIPVKDGNDGRFVNNDGTNGNPSTTSRSIWFNRLFSASASNGTPLQSVLDSAGQYFTSAADTGPYGPEVNGSTTAPQLSCRQNFTVLTTDGYWNGGTVNTGTSGDGGNGGIITNNPPVLVGDDNYKTYQYVSAAPYRDGNNNTLADVAMKYWKTDLRTDLVNDVPSGYSKVAGENDQVTRDPAFWQHMVTFTISIGLKASSGLSSVSEVTSATTWAAPGNDDVDNIDDLLHAAVNGRGTFVAASSPQAFADGLQAALAKVQERTASFSNVGATSSTQLNAGTLIFSASYVSGSWGGLLRAENAGTAARSRANGRKKAVPASHGGAGRVQAAALPPPGVFRAAGAGAGH